MITWNWFDTDCKNEWAIFTCLISLTGPLRCGTLYISDYEYVNIFSVTVLGIKPWLKEDGDLKRNNKKRSHTQLDSRKQVIAFQDRVITINIKEAQHPLKREKQVIDKSSIMLKISTKSMHRVLVWEIGPANNTTRCSRLSKRRLLHAWHPSQLAINLMICYIH